MSFEGLREEIRRSNYIRYTFFLMGQRGSRGNTGPVIVQGRIQEVGENFVRLRKSTGYRTHTDIVVPFNAILYFEETHLSSGGE